MNVIPPLEITDGRLTSTTVTEPSVGEAVFNPAAAYDTGDRVIVGSPTSAVTISIASPGVITWAAHGQADGTPVTFTTTGALPTGLTAGVAYYIINSAAGTFQVAATIDGMPIVTSGGQSGTHTATTQVHRTFQSREDANTGNSPMTSPDKWLDVGPTNRFAMFDLLRNTATVASSPLTVVITPGKRVDALGLVGLVADEVEVEVTVGATVVYSTTRSLRTRNVTDWYSHFFAEFTTASITSFLDLPPATGAVITIKISRDTGDVSCGGLILGTAVYIGETEVDPSDDAINFSRIDRDPDFGTAVLVPRRSVPRSAQRVWCPKANVRRVRALRDELNAMPALWLGLDDPTDGYFDSVQILGIYKGFKITPGHPDALIELDLEEV